MATVAPATPLSVQALSAKFVEDGAGTYTATFNLPENAHLIDIIVEAEAVWAAATSAALDIGDAADPNGWIAALNLKATDLLAGESVSLLSTQVRGGQAGAYLTVGTSTHIARTFSTAARDITAVVSSVGAGATGKTWVTVLYAVGSPTEITQ